MRKRRVASIVVTCSAILVAGAYIGAQAKPMTSISSSPLGITTTAPVSPSAPTTQPAVGPTSTQPSASAAPPPTATQKKTIQGDVINTPYGTVQVEVSFTGTKITDVKALKLTDRGSYSVQVSNYAVPVLRNEVLSNQSANVSSVSGATYTSQGYLNSVQSAIDKSKA